LTEQMNQKRENNTIPMHVAWNTIKATIDSYFASVRGFKQA